MGPRRWPLFWGVRALLFHIAVLTAGQRPQERPPRPPGWSPGPSSSWAPTLEPGAPGDAEGAAAALAFLRTGDAQRLARANCSGGVAAGPPGPGPPPALRAALRAAPEALAHAANFLNMLFQTNDIREASVAEDVEWYQALVRSLAEGHPWVRRAVLALDAHPLAPKPRLMLQATKGDGQILLQDVSAAAPSLGNLSWDNEWFNALKSQRTPALRKRVLSNDLRSMETPKWQRGDSYVGDSSHVRWSPPFLECRDGRFLPTWAVTLSSAFYGLKPDLSPEFKGVLRVDVELRDVTIDQCASGPGWFSDTHRCDLNSTQCVPQESRGFVLGRYLCRCKPGFYGAGGVASGAWAGAAGLDGGSRLACWPCRPGCATCEDDKPCLIQEDQVLRAAVLSCQACCMLAIFLSMLVSYHFRRSKRIRASGIILLETILFGSLLLYFPVFILYFKPSIFRCIVLRWVRMFGFATVYGTITLKLYRVLKVFLSRTAQRAPYVSSGRVLRMLAPILLLVLWFLAAWTIGMLENINKNIPLVIRTQTTHGLHFYICGHDCWDYMMVIAEMLFLLWGSFLCYATRAVPSAFHEPRYMGIALHNELMISTAFHVVRFIIVPSLHPDWTLLLFFAHTHGTITMTLALLFIPKFLHTGSPLREEITAEVYEDELDMRRSGSCLNSSIASAWSEHSLDPDDIREELKKLYRQLEVHKTWRMAANNPHLPRRRSSRRSLARSILRRGTADLPDGSSSRRSSAGDRVGTTARHGPSAKRDTGGAGSRMRDEGSRRRSSALRKSRSSSTEGPPRVSPTNSILLPEEPSPGSLDRSDSDSLDSAPLMCRSASAQNLSGHWRQPPARAPLLQKSHSVVSGAREEALLAASRAAREEWHTSRQLSAPASGYPPSHGPPKDTRKPKGPAKSCSQEDTSALGDAKVQKHVTYAPIKSVSMDSAHPPRKVRVAVRKTPPVPPVRYQSLGRHSVPAGECLEPAEPPPDPPAPVGETEGTPEGHPGHTDPAVGKGGLQVPAPISAQVCPWELIQDEILSRKQKAAEAADSGTPGDTEATTPSPRAPSQKTFRSLGLAIKALNRSRGKSILKGKRESEGSLRKRGSSRREKSSLAEASALSLGGISQDPTAKSPEGSRQRPEPPTRGHTVPCQQNNNAATPGETTGWGDSGTEGQWDSLALGTGGGDKVAEQPSTPWGDVDAGGGLEPPLGVHEVPPSTGHQGGAEHPCETLEVASRGKTAPGVEMGKDVPADIPAVTLEAGTAEGLQGTSGSIQPQDHWEKEQPPAKPTPSSPHPSTPQRAAREKPQVGVCPTGSLGMPVGRGALLRQEAIAPPEDSGIPEGEESPAKALEKVSSQPEPLGPGETQEQGRTVRAQICPWDMEGAQPEQEKQEGERERIRPKSLGVPSGSSLAAAGQPWGSASTREAPPKAAPRGLEPPEVPSRSPASARASVCPWEAEGAEADAEVCPWERGMALSKAGKPDGGEISQGQSGISPQAAAPGRVGGLALAADKGSSQKGSLRSGEALEQPGMGLPAKPPAVPKPSSQEAGTISSRKATICPWEVKDEPLPKTEICPWEEAAAPAGKERLSQDTRGTSKGEDKPGSRGLEDPKAKLAEMGSSQAQHRDTGIFARLVRKSLESSKAESKKSQSAENIKEEICPWESLGMEKPPEQPPARSTALPKSPSGKSQSTESLKAEICPWEAQEGKSSDRAEICPWEGAEPVLQRGRAPGKDKLPSKEASKPLEKGSKDRESICPWESLDMEQPPVKPQAGGTEPAKKSAEICPWESQELQSSDRAEICPWEGAEPPSHQSKVPSGGSRGDKHITRQAALASPERSLGKSERQAVCPWESLGTQEPSGTSQDGSTALPKSPAGKSQSTESLKAEICPWEAQEGKSSDKAEICPWEGAEAQLEKGRAPGKERLPSKEASKPLEKGSKDRESVCPWESLDTEQPLAKPQAGGTEPAKKSQSTESIKAEICPWEAQELKSSDRAEICPWEGAEPVLEKGTVPGKDKLPSKETDASKPVKKGSKDRESICPWESADTEQPPVKPQAGGTEPAKKSQSTESLKAEICPWESQELQSSDRAEICPWEGAEPPSHQSKVPSGGSRGDKRITRQAALASPERSLGKSERQAVCPWESLGTQEPSGTSQDGSTALPKSPSGKSQSTESLKAEICPWEAQEGKSSDKAEICPWEGAEAQLEKGRAPGKERLPSKEASKPLEKECKDRESICPWESLGTENPPEQPPARSTALLKSPSGKSQSTESLKAEICPWEAQEGKSSDRAEICPWEGAEPLLEKGRAPGKDKLPSKETDASKPLNKGSKDRESICPWESLDTEQPLAKPQAGGTEPAKKSQSTESIKAEICPWEAQEGKSSDRAEICPWEGAEPVLEKGRAPGKDKLPPKEVSTSKPQEKGSKDRESICPWESLDTEQPLAKPQAGGTEPAKKSQSTESLKAEICPWEAQEGKSSDRAEICPWEGAEAQWEKGRAQGKDKLPSKEASKPVEKGSKDRESICPWESLDMEQPPVKPQDGGTEPAKKSQSTESLKAEICPWESQELQSSDRAEICPWEGAEPVLEKGAAPGKERLPKLVAGTSAGSPTALLKKSKGSSDGEPKHKPLCRILPGIQPPQSSSSSPSTGLAQVWAWEAEEAPSAPAKPSTDTRKTSEVCPWEEEGVDPPPAPTGRAELGERGTQSEVCPWEQQQPHP
ncbi:probable G-protein coupled receptor 179 [Pithys albifrons albifrons]|uniref:probable G-protein coupled receptor 179 n=1 Tax=Pithys albifrons albifrons TaxID=3385563 RepID=UPI003A5D1F6D